MYFKVTQIVAENIPIYYNIRHDQFASLNKIAIALRMYHKNRNVVQLKCICAYNVCVSLCSVVYIYINNSTHHYVMQMLLNDLI